MSFPQYPKYKDSGVAWLGEVPEHWDVKRLGAYFDERREKVSDKDFPALSVTKSGIVPQIDTAAKTDDGDNRKKVTVGDFVINSRSDRKGSSGVSPLDGSVSLINTVLKSTNGIAADFVHTLLRSQPFQEEYYRYGKGIVADLWSTNYSEMRNILLAIPAPGEQTAIARFIQRETEKIDALVEEQRRLIELLKEKRQAVISLAVTKGLNPDAPFKDSGIEWLGEVPEHWRIARFSYLAKKIVDGTHFTPTYVAEGVPFLRVTDITSPEIDLLEVKRIPRSEHEALTGRCRPEVGDLLLSKNGTIGVPKVVTWDWEFSIFVSLCLIKLMPSLNPFFVSYLFLSSTIKTQIEDGTKQSTVINLHLEKIQAFKIPVPPIDEQEKMVSFLKKQTSKIDRLMAEAIRAIDLLQERRTALISAAVTGKIDVRGLANEDAA